MKATRVEDRHSCLSRPVGFPTRQRCNTERSVRVGKPTGLDGPGDPSSIGTACSFTGSHCVPFWHLLSSANLSQAQVAKPYFGIHVVDDQTGRGVPLIEFRTVNDIRCVTDNAGWIAFHEPGLMNREVWFYFSLGPGYEMKKDGFGFTGIRVTPVAGESTTVKITRSNIAERIARTTGQGMYRDSELLGLPHPLPNLNPAGVMGQDSVQATPYQGKIFWLWGDTNVPQYPLGNFRTTCALSSNEAKPEDGMAYEYFIDPAAPSHLRAMMPDPEPGAVWLFGLLSLKDDIGKRRPAGALWTAQGTAGSRGARHLPLQ